MSGFLLDVYPASSTIYAFFHTFNSSGASVTISNFATSDIQIYKNGSMTQRSSASGFTLLDTDGIDVDTNTGIHAISIDLSDNTDAGFYAAGSQYTVVIASITADSQTVNFVLGTFWIRAAESIAGKPKVDVDAISGSAVSTTTAQIGTNIVKVANTTVNGAGTAGNPWGP